MATIVSERLMTRDDEEFRKGVSTLTGPSLQFCIEGMRAANKMKAEEEARQNTLNSENSNVPVKTNQADGSTAGTGGASC